MKTSILYIFSVAALVAAPVSGIIAAPEHGVMASDSHFSDSSRVVDLDEVVVVSQSKEYHQLRRLPLSSTVMTDQEMERLQVRSLSQLSNFVPSFVMPSYGSRLTSSVYVRGIGSRTGNPAVGVYYDQIPLSSKSAFNQHFYGINRVDVLRGPQGTLYGLNAEGGVVRVYSKNPMDYQGTELSASLASGLESQVELSHYAKPSERMAFSVQAFYHGQKGFFHHQQFSDRADLSNEAGARLRVVNKPTDRLTLDFFADWQYVNQNGFAYGEYDEQTDSWNNPSSTLMNGYRRQMVNTGLRSTVDLGTCLLNSATSYQYLNDAMQMDQDYLPGDYMRLNQDQKMNAVIEEITLRHKRHDKVYAQTSGAIFHYQWLRTDGPVFFGDDMNAMIKQNMGMPPMIANAISLSDNEVPGVFHTPQLNVGIYHESTLRLADPLTLTLGLRYDFQRHSIDYATESHFRLNYSGMMGGQPMTSSHQYRSRLDGTHHTTYQQLLPKVALSWQLSDDGNQIYASVSKGFRAGGYNLQMFSDIFKTEQQQMGQKLMQLSRQDIEVPHEADDYEQVNRTISYKPETSWNYELGTHLNLFGRSLHLDASVFFMQIRNQQLSVMAGEFKYGRMMVNAGRSSSLGAEVTLRGSHLDDRLQWTASYGFTHATFRHYQEDSVDYRGNHVPFMPTHSVSLTADYRLASMLTIGADFHANGPIYWDSENRHKQSLYGVLGAHALFDFGAFSVNVWGKNLTNSRYNTFLVESAADGVKRNFAQRSNPIQLGVDVAVKF